MRLSLLLIATLVAMVSVHMTSSVVVTKFSLVKSATALAIVGGLPSVTPFKHKFKKLKIALGAKALFLALKLPKLAKLKALKLLLLKGSLLKPFLPVKVLIIGAAMLATGAGLAIAAGVLLKKIKKAEEEEDEYEAPYEPTYNSYEPAAPSTSYGTPAYSPPAPVAQYAPAPPASYSALPLSYDPVAPVAQQTYPINPTYAAPAGTYSHVYKRSAALEDEFAAISSENLHKTLTKRSTDDDDDDEDEDEVEDNDVDFASLDSIERSELADEYFYMAAQMDQQGCARKVVCEVFHKQYNQLTLEEKIMRHMFGPTLTLPRSDELETARGIFRQAAYYGVTTSAIPTSCAQAYASCPYNSDSLLSNLYQTGIATNSL